MTGSKTYKPRVIGVLLGDINQETGARVKYGHFLKALGQRFPLTDCFDAELRGIARLVNAVLTIHPNKRQWRERFYKNEFAFRTRSRYVSSYLQSRRHQADVILQIGVLFDACWGKNSLPSVIYTDYTASLAAQKSDLTRSPFNGRQLERWIALERQAFQRATFICTRSHIVRDSIVNDYGISPQQVMVTGGGVNFEKLPDPNSKTNSGAPTVLFIGKQFYRKGGDLLLQAFARVRQQIPDAHLLLLTEGPIAPDLPLSGVEVIAPTWQRGAVEALYRRTDLFILPSRLETWGDVILEAMAYGIPCIGIQGEPMGEIIEHGATGLVVPAENTDALSQALTYLLTRPDLRRAWGQAARQRVETEFTWQRVVERIEPAIKAAAQT